MVVVPISEPRLAELARGSRLTRPLHRQAARKCLAVSRDQIPAVQSEMVAGPPAARKSAMARVLVVEDNSVNQLVTLRVLRKLGHFAEAANNGQEAIDALKKASYDLILMDCQMPVVDGFEATRRIRSGDAGQAAITVPIVALTANALKGDDTLCFDAGMDAYLTKPVRVGDLSQAIAQWTGARGGFTAAAAV